MGKYQLFDCIMETRVNAFVPKAVILKMVFLPILLAYTILTQVYSVTQETVPHDLMVSSHTLNSRSLSIIYDLRAE